MSDFGTNIIGNDPSTAHAVAGYPRPSGGTGKVSRFIRRHATPLTVVIGVPVILASASVFTAHDGNNYDSERYCGQTCPSETLPECAGDEIPTVITCVHVEGDGWRVR